VTIRVDGFDAVVGEVLFVSILVEEARFEPLLGYVTLE
jgi:hypothetical protein